MFELEVRSPRHIRLRIGRWHFRTWHPRFMRLPRGYATPETVYAVHQLGDDRDNIDVTYAHFFSEPPAAQLLERLVSDGVPRERLVISVESVHFTYEDYEHDR